MKYLLFAAILILFPILAQAQMTCSAVTATTQNCLVTITVVPGTPSGTQVQATSFDIRRSDGGGTKTVIGNVLINNLVLQNTFTDTGGVQHCYDAVGKAPNGTSSTSQQQCWTTPAMAPPSITTPTINLSAISSGTIRITWDDVENETQYEFWGRTAKGNQKYSLVASLPADTVTWDWTGRKRYTSYCGIVRAKAGSFDGQFSSPNCATTSK